MRLPVSHVLPLAALIFTVACSSGGNTRSAGLPPMRTGPAADYPVVVGDPYTIDGMTYTPVDKLNYDEVGHAQIAAGDSSRITGSSKTLPLPSYVEVTALDSGKTILVRMETRGPLTNDALIELSAGAAAQLGISGRAPVRVRRVNPPEPERALLRGGYRVPDRMDTPKPLLAVLLRKLNQQEPLSAPNQVTMPAPTQSANSAPIAPPVKPPLHTPPVITAPEPVSSPIPAPPPKAIPDNALVVQVGAFSSKARADSVAQGLEGAFVGKPRQFWVVRTGPFRTHAQAQAALAKAKSAGYIDARIQRAGD